MTKDVFELVAALPDDAVPEWLTEPSRLIVTRGDRGVIFYHGSDGRAHTMRQWPAGYTISTWDDAMRELDIAPGMGAVVVPAAVDDTPTQPFRLGAGDDMSRRVLEALENSGARQAYASMRAELDTMPWAGIYRHLDAAENLRHLATLPARARDHARHAALGELLVPDAVAIYREARRARGVLRRAREHELVMLLDALSLIVASVFAGSRRKLGTRH